MNCATCRFWNRKGHFLTDKGHAWNGTTEADAAGECRANPPIPVASVGGGYRMFPITRAVDGCGSYEANKPVVAIEPEPGPQLTQGAPHPANRRRKSVDKPDG
jgi:hypothetical protein